MSIKLSGLVSGMDTESMIKELMSAQNTKKHKVQSKITKLEWKQDKWKELNTKIYALYTDTLSQMRFENTYQAKKASSTNEGKLTVSAGTNASEGTHTVTVDKLRPHSRNWVLMYRRVSAFRLTARILLILMLMKAQL